MGLKKFPLAFFVLISFPCLSQGIKSVTVYNNVLLQNKVYGTQLLSYTLFNKNGDTLIYKYNDPESYVEADFYHNARYYNPRKKTIIHEYYLNKHELQWKLTSKFNRKGELLKTIYSAYLADNRVFEEKEITYKRNTGGQLVEEHEVRKQGKSRTTINKGYEYYPGGGLAVERTLVNSVPEREVYYYYDSAGNITKKISKHKILPAGPFENDYTRSFYVADNPFYVSTDVYKYDTFNHLTFQGRVDSTGDTLVLNKNTFWYVKEGYFKKYFTYNYFDKALSSCGLIKYSVVDSFVYSCSFRPDEKEYLDNLTLSDVLSGNYENECFEKPRTYVIYKKPHTVRLLMNSNNQPYMELYADGEDFNTVTKITLYEYSYFK